MKKVGLMLLCGLFSIKAFSADCEQLVRQKIEAETLTASLFDNHKSLFIVVACDKKRPLYQMFYAQMHPASQHKINLPTASLSPVKLPINPNLKNHTTGFLVANKTPKNSYTLKLRARLTDGKAIDMSKTAELLAGESLIFVDNGITVGLARLPAQP